MRKKVIINNEKIDNTFVFFVYDEKKFQYNCNKYKCAIGVRKWLVIYC